MRLTSPQFDGGGDYLPATPAAPIAPAPSSVNTTTAEGVAAASAAPAYKEPGKGAGMKMGSAKAKAPVDKSGYDRSIKVPQATVDAVKKDGSKVAANKVTYGSPGYDGSMFSPNAPVSKEYKEATKRVYPSAKATPPNASGATNPNQPGPAKPTPNFKLNPKGAAGQNPFPPILPPASKSTPKSSTPKSATPAKVKVSQATVDSVKSQGKTKAIANAKTNVTNAEYKEAVRRVYQSPAKAKPTPKAKSGGGGRASAAVK
jgi:hypothetical protein